MKNLYQKTHLLSRVEFKRIEEILQSVWSKETTHPDLSEKWDSNNKALGQCAPTSLLVYDLLGGRILYDKQNFHLWNELPDSTEIDFSRSQFVEKTSFSVYKYKTKEELLSDESAIRTNLLTRYELLKQKFQKHYK